MNVTIIPCPGMTSFIMFQEFDFKGVKARKHVDVELHMKGKTRVSISLYDPGKTCNHVNNIPPGSEKFKFHTEEFLNYATGNRSSKNLFVLSKKQGWPEMKEHLKNLIAHFFDLQPSDEFEIRIHNDRNLAVVRSFKDEVKQTAAPVLF